MTTKYEVMAVKAVFTAGQRLHLTKAQAGSRTHSLKHITGNSYEVTDRVEFKRGETLGVDGTVSKIQLQEIAPAKPAKAEATLSDQLRSRLVEAGIDPATVVASATGKSVTKADVDAAIAADAQRKADEAEEMKKSAGQGSDINEKDPVNGQPGGNSNPVI